MAETAFFDAAETRAPAAREDALMAALRLQVARAKARAPHYRESLAAVDPDALTDRAALAALPVLSKTDLIEMQEAAPPFGGVAADEPGAMARLFLSPGPIAEPQGEDQGDAWRMARAMHAAGFRRGDRVLNCFSYHLTPAGFMFDAAARALGCAVFPGGVGATDQQVQAIARLALSGYVGTPDFLKIILEKAQETGADAASMRRALVTGGPLFPATRAWYVENGVSVLQCYGTAELGLVAYETTGADGALGEGLVVAEDCIVEIVRPGTGAPVAEGEVGEVVVTTFDPAYPLIRFATGDLSAMLPGAARCGRTGTRIKGWMGRADQTTKVKGMFVHPRQVAAVLKPYPEIAKARLEVTAENGEDRMTLHCEAAEPDPALADRIAESIRAECRVRGAVAFVAPGALPNDGKVIDDQRRYDG